MPSPIPKVGVPGHAIYGSRPPSRSSSTSSGSSTSASDETSSVHSFASEVDQRVPPRPPAHGENAGRVHALGGDASAARSPDTRTPCLDHLAADVRPDAERQMSTLQQLAGRSRHGFLNYGQKKALKSAWLRLVEYGRQHRAAPGPNTASHLQRQGMAQNLDTYLETTLDGIEDDQARHVDQAFQFKPESLRPFITEEQERRLGDLLDRGGRLYAASMRDGLSAEEHGALQDIRRQMEELTTACTNRVIENCGERHLDGLHGEAREAAAMKAANEADQTLDKLETLERLQSVLRNRASSVTLAMPEEPAAVQRPVGAPVAGVEPPRPLSRDERYQMRTLIDESEAALAQAMSAPERANFAALEEVRRILNGSIQTITERQITLTGTGYAAMEVVKDQLLSLSNGIGDWLNRARATPVAGSAAENLPVTDLSKLEPVLTDDEVSDLDGLVKDALAFFNAGSQRPPTELSDGLRAYSEIIRHQMPDLQESDTYNGAEAERIKLLTLARSIDRAVESGDIRLPHPTVSGHGSAAGAG